MEMLNAEIKLLYLTAFACFGVGVYALNPVLIVGGIACFVWIGTRWWGPHKVKRVPKRPRNETD